MLPQLPNTNCIIVHYLTDGVSKKIQDKTSIAMSCVAQPPCRGKQLTLRPRAVSTNPKIALLGYLLHWQ